MEGPSITQLVGLALLLPIMFGGLAIAISISEAIDRISNAKAEAIRRRAALEAHDDGK